MNPKRFTKYPQRVTAAEAPKDSKLSEMLNSLEDDFDYLIAGLEKLDRTGATESNEGLIIAEKFSAALQSAISAISDKM